VFCLWNLLKFLLFFLASCLLVGDFFFLVNFIVVVVIFNEYFTFINFYNLEPGGLRRNVKNEITATKDVDDQQWGKKKHAMNHMINVGQINFLGSAGGVWDFEYRKDVSQILPI